MAPKLTLLMSSDSKKKEPRYTCLCEAKASHSQTMWTEVSSSPPHLLHSGVSDSPARWRCLLRVLCPVRRSVTALDCVLLKDRNLALAPRQGPEISSRACLKFQGNVPPLSSGYLEDYVSRIEVGLLTVILLQPNTFNLQLIKASKVYTAVQATAFEASQLPDDRGKASHSTATATFKDTAIKNSNITKDESTQLPTQIFSTVRLTATSPIPSAT